MRVRNRITLVTNEQRVGTTANLFFHVGKFCAREDIVLVLSPGSQLLSSQALRRLSSAYQSPEVMFAWNRILLERSPYDLVSSQQSEPNERVSSVSRQYSTKRAIRSFRRQLID